MATQAVGAWTLPGVRGTGELGRRLPFLSSLGALGFLIGGLAGGFWPTWPLWSTALLIVAGLLAEPAGLLLGRRSPAVAQPASMILGLITLSVGFSQAHPSAPLLWGAAILLAVGLVSGPLGTGFVHGTPPRLASLPVAALGAMLVLMWSLAVDGYWWYTGAPQVRFINDRLDVGTLRLVILALALVLAAAALPGPRTIYRLLGTLVALGLLVSILVAPPAHGLWPAWPIWSAIVVLCSGLIEPLTQLLGLSPTIVLAERVDELSRTRSGALDVQATELRRIERDLHDGAQVRLVALSMKLGRAEDRYRDDPETAALLREAREDAAAAIRELRELARGIAPPVLARRGLEAAVRSVAQRSGLQVAVRSNLTDRLPPAVETAAYFVVGESLANAAKHGAGARVEVDLHRHGEDLVLEITDFGPGGADPTGGGLTGLRQRVEALDGVLRVTSPEGVGTQIEAVMPCGR